MELFDCNCWYGVPRRPPLAGAETAEVLVEEMARAGIDTALVRNAAIFEQSPVTGNRLTSDDCAKYEALEPSWGILPPQTDELGDLDEFIAAMRRENVRSLWAYPEKHRYLLSATTMGGLFEEMVCRGVPLFLRRNEMPGKFDTYELAERVLLDFPGLRLIIVAHGSWGEDRLFRPLMERFPNFAVDTSRYELDGGIEEICNTCGPTRLLFGTNFPETPMGGPLLTLLQANISDDDRALIAGGNLRGMLEEVRL